MGIKIKFGRSDDDKIRERIAEIERKTGKKIDVDKVLRDVFSMENVKAGTIKSIKVVDKMLNENINDYVEVGTKKKGDVKVDYGFRMRFLDEENQRFSSLSTLYDKELKDDDKKEKDYENEKLKKWKKK